MFFTQQCFHFFEKSFFNKNKKYHNLLKYEHFRIIKFKGG
nr:MAG TPA: hypothetical protein [Caudoviricetes sp.]